MADALASEFVALQQALAGRYSLERELGRGGMGIVYLARDVALDRPVAIKLLPPAMAAQPSLRERFLREARTAAQLSHPNIVPIHMVEQLGDLVFFVMAYVEGETLGQRVRGKGPLPPAQATRVLQEVAWALAYAHLRSIVHRDIKPDNILLESGTGRALVSDFGIARAAETTGGTAVGEILGTAHYMSPEQACGEQVDGRSDLYSLGVVGFFALSGKLPFEAPDVAALLAMQITRPAPPLSTVAPGVPGRVAQAVDKCLAKAPEDRWPTGEAFAETLAESTSVMREMPAPLRVWLTRGDAARTVLYGWTGIMGISLVFGTVNAILRGSNFSLGPLVWILGPWAAFGFYRAYQTQRVLATGYGLEDLRIAFRQHVEQKREELAFEYDRDPPIWARAIRWLSFGGVAVAAGAAAAVALFGLSDPYLFGYVFGGGTAVAVGGGILGRLFPGRRLKARDSTLEYRLKLFEGALGPAMVRIAHIGLQRPALPAASFRPTELAIGMAADQIFESLSKTARRALKGLPLLVRRLEAEAQGMRARVDELNAMLAGLGDTASASTSASLRTAGAGAVVQDNQQRLRVELLAKREAASRRLAASVAALENIRLDLLRLKAGVGTVDQLTADLSAAQELQEEIERRIEATREVEAALEGTP
jgi:serine/threonine-protein kinase